MTELTLNTVPVAKGRPRFYGGHAVTPQRTRVYEKLIRDSWTGGQLHGAVYVDIEFHFPVPKSYSKKRRAELIGKPHTSRPDLDNLVKAVLDGLNGVAFDDDAMIAGIVATKTYAEEPAVVIRMEGIPMKDHCGHESETKVYNCMTCRFRRGFYCTSWVTLTSAKMVCSNWMQKDCPCGADMRGEANERTEVCNLQE